LREAVRVSGARAKVHQCRFEDLNPEAFGGEVDILTARAVAPLSNLLKLSEVWIKNGAKALFYKGQDVGTELTEATKCWRINFIQQPNLCDSRGCILDIREIERVTRV
jgi:16S rRNA (guanine527-N7)-methyltransferase